MLADPRKEDWLRQMNRVEAVATLCVPISVVFGESDRDNRAQVEQLVQGGFDGYTERLAKAIIFDIRENGARRLSETVSAVRQSMLKLHLDSHHVMMPILWMRLIARTNRNLAVDRIRDFNQWLVHAQQTSPIYFQRHDSQLARWKTKAFSPIELMLNVVPLGIVNPYACKWRIRPASNALEVADAIAETSPTISRGKKSEDDWASPLLLRRKRNTVRLDAARQRCGSAAVDALIDAIRAEVSRQTECNILFTIPKAAADRYRCAMSKDELVLFLQNRHKSLAKLSASTLKNALSVFVECPRGRPTTKTQVVKYR